MNDIHWELKVYRVENSQRHCSVICFYWDETNEALNGGQRRRMALIVAIGVVCSAPAAHPDNHNNNNNSTGRMLTQQIRLLSEKEFFNGHFSIKCGRGSDNHRRTRMAQQPKCNLDYFTNVRLNWLQSQMYSNLIHLIHICLFVVKKMVKFNPPYAARDVILAKFNTIYLVTVNLHSLAARAR